MMCRGLGLLVLSSVICSSVATLSAGSIQIEGLGQAFVLPSAWANDFVQVDDNNGFTLSGGGRVYLAKVDAQDFSDPHIFLQMNIYEKEFSYTVDISNVGCGCNGGAYLTYMPTPVQSNSGEWYCDANAIEGLWCPEYDLIESNKYVMMTTMHACVGDSDDWVECDRYGCQTNSYVVQPDMLGPGDQFTINTLQPFTVTHYQTESNTMVYLKQGEASAEYEVCTEKPEYSEDMVDVYQKMVFVGSLWGEVDMSWLDGVTGCTEDCRLADSSISFSNFSLLDRQK